MSTDHDTTKTGETGLERCSRKLIVMNRIGLHVRAARMIATLAREFDADIHIESAQGRADAGNILAILSLGASPGTEVTVTAAGHDAGKAIQRMADLFARRFDEAEEQRT